MGLYEAAEQLRTMGRPFDEVIAAYERASNAAPNRAEALHGAKPASAARTKSSRKATNTRARGLRIPPAGDGRILQKWIYDYGLLDELAVNAYWTERYQECLDVLRLSPSSGGQAASATCATA